VTYGGNLDLKKLSAGSTLYIPVQVPDALFYVGDGHARQGDGECCGTALETALTGTFRFTLHKKEQSSLKSVVRAETAKELIAIGVERTVDAAVTAAVQNMVDWVQELSPQTSNIDAECLCSIAGDIAVTQIVNGDTRGAHMTLQKDHLPNQ
jgi:acetamidase/formamidase